VLRGTDELLPEFGVLGRDTHGAGVEMAFTHHDTAHGNQRCGSEAPLFGTKQTSNGDVTTCSELTVSLDDDTSSEIIQYQGLMSFSQAKFPRKTSILDTSPSGGTGTTIVAGNQDMIGLGLSDTGSDDTHTNLGNELDGNSRTRARALQIVDQLFEILNGVNVVVGRR
jgi:hypothetical protein